jgi:hypothetical protein
VAKGRVVPEPAVEIAANRGPKGSKRGRNVCEEPRPPARDRAAAPELEPSETPPPVVVACDDGAPPAVVTVPARAPRPRAAVVWTAGIVPAIRRRLVEAPANRRRAAGAPSASNPRAAEPPPSVSPLVRDLPASFWDDDEPPAPSRSGRHARRGWLAFVAVAAALLVFVASRSLDGQTLAVATWSSLVPLGQKVGALFGAANEGETAAAAEVPEPDPEPAEPDRIRRDGHGSIKGGVVFVPDTFTAKDGAYDLLLHFHGNTKVVKESAEVAGLDAIVAVVNLGVGSAPYEDAYAVPGTYEALLEQIQRVVGQRGVSNPHVRRIALASWSAGYGALSTILNVRRGTDPLDAILVLDGIHCGWLDERPNELNPLQLGPFVRAAKLAAEGQLLFTITHSEIDPPTYASSAETAAYLLSTVGYRPPAALPSIVAPPHVVLRSAEGAVAKKLEKRMEPFSDARVGGLHVRGYRGNTPEHHMAHLLQMAATVVPELVERWRTIPASVPTPRTAP